MNLSDVNIAKHLFVRLSIDGDMSGLEEGNLLNIEEVDDHNEFIVNQYGDTVSGEKQNYLAKTDFKNAKYIHEILENERNGHNKNLFLIDSIDEKSIIIQTKKCRLT